MATLYLLRVIGAWYNANSAALRLWLSPNVLAALGFGLVGLPLILSIAMWALLVLLLLLRLILIATGNLHVVGPGYDEIAEWINDGPIHDSMWWVAPTCALAAATLAAAKPRNPDLPPISQMSRRCFAMWFTVFLSVAWLTAFFALAVGDVWNRGPDAGVGRALASLAARTETAPSESVSNALLWWPMAILLGASATVFLASLVPAARKPMVWIRPTIPRELRTPPNPAAPLPALPAPTNVTSEPVAMAPRITAGNSLEMVLVDASTVARSVRAAGANASLRALCQMISELRTRKFYPLVIADASLRHHFSADEKTTYEQMVRDGEIFQAPAGDQADRYILEYAGPRGLRIVTADEYRDWRTAHPFLNERPWKIRFMFVGDVLMFNFDSTTPRPTGPSPRATARPAFSSKHSPARYWWN